MIQVSVKNLQGIVTHAAKWTTEAEADAWIAKCIASSAWGNTEHWVEDFKGDRAKLAEADVWYEEIFEDGRSKIRCHFPLNYTVHKEDVSAQVAQAKVNQDALHYLKETDWYVIREYESGVAIPDDVKQSRHDARMAVIKQE